MWIWVYIGEAAGVWMCISAQLIVIIIAGLWG